MSQHGNDAEHEAPGSAHVGGVTGGWHVPAVAPSAMSQVVPAQQSPSAVQLPPVGRQETHFEPSHLPVQHWPFDVHAEPVAEQFGRAQWLVAASQ